MFRPRPSHALRVVSPFDLSLSTYLAACFGAFCLGFSKAGFPGLALVNVVIMAELFGGKASVGLILPLLVTCDLIIFPLFRKYASWKDTLPLLAITTLGVFLGYFIMGAIQPSTCRHVIGGLILLMLALQAIQRMGVAFILQLKGAAWFRWWCGGLMGVSTMLANAAAPAYSLFALANQWTKHQFLGIGARCFLVLNLLKVPLMADLDMITRHSLSLDAALLPALLIGIALGRRLIERIPQKAFEWLLYAFTLVAGFRLLLF